MSAAEGVSEQELAGLSPEERAALAGDEEDKSVLKEVADETAGDDADEGGDEDQDDAGDDVESDDADDDADDAGEEEDEGGEVGKAATPVPAGDDDEPFIPRYMAPAVEQYNEQVRALDAQRTEVIAQFKAGTIEPDAMDEKLREIESQRRDLDQRKLKADIAAEQHEQTAQQQWQWEVKRFLRNAAAEGVDYRVDAAQAALDAARKGADQAAITSAETALRSARMLNAALDAEVKALGSDERYRDKPSEWFLEEAHRTIRERFNLGRPAGDKPDGQRRPAGRKPDLRSVPKTLGDIPGAGTDDSSTGDDGFSHLDKLSGMDLESAVARMSRADQERWARGAA